jgi:hypothetical protein
MMAMIKNLVNKNNSIELNGVLQDEIQKGNDPECVNILAKAAYVAELVEGGMDLNDAIRKLGKQMRQFSQQE